MYDVSMQLHMYTYMYVHIRVCMYGRMYSCQCVMFCLFVCMFACVYANLNLCRLRSVTPVPTSSVWQTYGGGGGRQRSYGYVRDPAVGFFIAGSTVKDLNGVYQRVEQVRRGRRKHAHRT